MSVDDAIQAMKKPSFSLNELIIMTGLSKIIIREKLLKLKKCGFLDYTESTDEIRMTEFGMFFYRIPAE
jgi:hypothetical protein